jgi:hypothetical protein
MQRHTASYGPFNMTCEKIHQNNTVKASASPLLISCTFNWHFSNYAHFFFHNHLLGDFVFAYDLDWDKRGIWLFGIIWSGVLEAWAVWVVSRGVIAARHARFRALIDLCAGSWMDRGRQAVGSAQMRVGWDLWGHEATQAHTRVRQCFGDVSLSFGGLPSQTRYRAHPLSLVIVAVFLAELP